MCLSWQKHWKFNWKSSKPYIHTRSKLFDLFAFVLLNMHTEQKSFGQMNLENYSSKFILGSFSTINIKVGHTHRTDGHLKKERIVAVDIVLWSCCWTTPIKNDLYGTKSYIVQKKQQYAMGMAFYSNQNVWKHTNSAQHICAMPHSFFHRPLLRAVTF